MERFLPLHIIAKFNKQKGQKRKDETEEIELDNKVTKVEPTRGVKRGDESEEQPSSKRPQIEQEMISTMERLGWNPKWLLNISKEVLNSVEELCKHLMARIRK